MKVVTEARTLINESTHGVLSTISAKLEGFPFGSVVTYCTDKNGWPTILISGIAEHTKKHQIRPKGFVNNHDSK